MLAFHFSPRGCIDQPFTGYTERDAPGSAESNTRRCCILPDTPRSSPPRFDEGIALETRERLSGPVPATTPSQDVPTPKASHITAQGRAAHAGNAGHPAVGVSGFSGEPQRGCTIRPDRLARSETRDPTLPREGRIEPLGVVAPSRQRR